MYRQDLLRALARVTGESVGYLQQSGFQFHQRFPLPNQLAQWPRRLRQRDRLRSRHQRRVRFRRLY